MNCTAGKSVRSNRIVILAVALLLSPVWSVWVRADDAWSLVDARFQSRQVSLQGVDADGIHVAGAAVVPWTDFLEISRPMTAIHSSGNFDIYLSSGDHISGEPVSMTDQSMQWKSPVLGEIPLPMSQVAAIVRAGKAPLALDQVRKDDVVQLANGDSTHGTVAQITATSVSIQTDNGTPTLGFDTVASIFFATPATQPAADSKPSICVRMADGTSITVRSVTISGDKLTAQFDANTSREVPMDGVTAIEQINGPVSWLTSRRPAENVYRPFFNENFPVRFDRTVDGEQTIAQRFPGIRHGIGCHSYSKLVYNLDGKYAAFRTQYAVDSDSPLADVAVRIKLDERTVFEDPSAKGGKTYPVQVIALGSAKTLTLEVDYGANYATQGRFAWLDPALLRDLPATAPTHP